MPRPRSSPKSSATAAYSAPLSKIIASTRSGEVVAIIGSGVSISLTNNTIPALSWRGLIQNGLDHAVTKGKITGPQAKPWKQLLASPDIDDLLSVAECVTRRLEAPGDLYARWLENTFKTRYSFQQKNGRSHPSHSRRSHPICTLNYDTLLEQVTSLPTVNLTDKKSLRMAAPPNARRSAPPRLLGFAC